MAESTPRQPLGRAGVATRSLAIALVIAATGLWLAWSGSFSSPSKPVDAVLDDAGWADENTCRACHPTIVDNFKMTGHARTLQPALATESSELLSRLRQPDPPLQATTSVQVSDEMALAVCDRPQGRESIALDWCFGSGRHARTWVGTFGGSRGETEMLELRWSWYPAINRFGLTPDQKEVPPPGYFAGLGVLFDAPKTQRCFSCHASQLSVSNGRIDFAKMQAGINCQRCHGPMRRHVEQALSNRLPPRPQRGESPLESINRCGQCHRRADEQPPSDIRHNNPVLARFQPVGLSQSLCFERSKSMTCETCHDPHLPLERQWLDEDGQCLQCHDPKRLSKAKVCAAGHTRDCLGCHMPKLETGAPTYFTDHWIRVRDDAPSKEENR